MLVLIGERKLPPSSSHTPLQPQALISNCEGREPVIVGVSVWEGGRRYTVVAGDPVAVIIPSLSLCLGSTFLSLN